MIAHEVGHHVQNLLGILPKVQQQQRGSSKARGEPAAGAGRAAGRLLRRRLGARTSDKQWKFIEPGDVEAAMQTAAAIGDDRLQKQAQGYVVPDCFTHGSSEQRQRWFKTGFKTGTVVEPATPSRAAQLVSSASRGMRERAMPGIDESPQFIPLKIAVLTVSDTRALDDDKSGATLAERIEKAGHAVGGARDRHRRRGEDPRAGESLDRRSGDRRRHHHRRHRLHRPRRDAGSARAAVREAHGRLRDAVPDGEPRQDRHLGDPDARDRGRRGRDLHLLPAGLARRLPRRLGRDPLHQLDYRYRPCNFVEIMPRLDEHLRRAKAQGATV